MIGVGSFLALLCGAALVGAVLVAVQHAEVVAHRCLQSGLNLAIGSALASIGLTVLVVVPASIVFDLPLVLGLEPKDLAMPALTFVVSAITLGAHPKMGTGSESSRCLSPFWDGP